MQPADCNPYAPPTATALPYADPSISLAPELAGVGARVVAHVVDNLAVFGPPLVIAAVSDSWPLPAALFWLAALVGITVQLVTLCRHGQSLGKRMMGIRVVSKDGEPATVPHIVGRALATLLVAGGCGVLGLIDAVMIFGPERRTLHDRLAGTRVVRAR